MHVQGLTLKNVVVSFELIKQRSFNYGQIYVALSRATSLQGLHILGNIDMKHIKANPKVDKEYERLREMSSIEHNLPSTNDSYLENNGITISVLNIRSLQKHSIDVKCDANMTNSDIIAFTETQMLPHYTDNDIRDNLQQFNLFRQDHQTDKFMSLAVCTKDHIQITSHEYFPSINALKFVVEGMINGQIQSFLLLYRKQSTHIPGYITALQDILSTHDIDTVLGDFNINYMSDEGCYPLNSMMKSLDYKQIVQQPTFISSGSLLDHVYIKSSYLNILQNDVINVYYSDHDAIKINIHKHAF